MSGSVGTQSHIHELAMWIYGNLHVESDSWVHNAHIVNSCEFYRGNTSLDDIPVALRYLEDMELVSVYEQFGSKYYRARTAQDIALGICRLRLGQDGMMFVSSFL